MARTLWGSPLFASDLLPFSSLPLPVVASLLTAFLFVSAEPVLLPSAFNDSTQDSCNSERVFECDR